MEFLLCAIVYIGKKKPYVGETRCVHGTVERHEHRVGQPAHVPASTPSPPVEPRGHPQSLIGTPNRTNPAKRGSRSMGGSARNPNKMTSTLKKSHSHNRGQEWTFCWRGVKDKMRQERQLWEASAARDYRLAEPAEVENEAIPLSSRCEQAFRIGGPALEKRVPRRQIRESEAPAGRSGPDVRRAGWPRSRPPPICNLGLVSR